MGFDRERNKTPAVDSRTIPYGKDDCSSLAFVV